jgi:hypothetical protein
MDLLVYAVLIKIHSNGRAVQVYSSPMQNVVTSLKQGIEFVIIIIKAGKTYRLFRTLLV